MTANATVHIIGEVLMPPADDMGEMEEGDMEEGDMQEGEMEEGAMMPDRSALLRRARRR